MLHYINISDSPHNTLNKLRMAKKFQISKSFQNLSVLMLRKLAPVRFSEDRIKYTESVTFSP